TGYALSTFADISELDAPKVSETALERAKLNKAQMEVQPGKFDVVIDPHAWSEMLFFFIVSASAGYSADFGTRQYKEGRSYLSGRIGEKIMGENVILEDDVYHPLQMGPPFDGEGYPKSKLTLVENGELRSLASSRISAHRYQDAKPTGHELPLPNRLETHPSPARQCLSLGSWQRTSTLPASRLSRTRDDFETDLAEHLVVGYSIKRERGRQKLSLID